MRWAAAVGVGVGVAVGVAVGALTSVFLRLAEGLRNDSRRMHERPTSPSQDSLWPSHDRSTNANLS